MLTKLWKKRFSIIQIKKEKLKELKKILREKKTLLKENNLKLNKMEYTQTNTAGENIVFNYIYVK